MLGQTGRMKLQKLFAFILQLIAIYFVMVTIAYWSPYAVGWLGSPEDIGKTRLSFVAMLAVAILLCAFASDISRKCVEESSEITIGSLTLVDCYTIVFFYLAISCFLGSASYVFYFVADLFRRKATENPSRDGGLNLWEFSRTFLPVIIGFAILVNARRWSVAYARKQGALPKPPETIAREDEGAGESPLQPPR
jgi:hypothetical protein